MNRIVFLGTGGGGFLMIKQVLATGGIYVELDSHHIIIDPGPGCLVMARRFNIDLTRVDLLLLSHFHPDHATDANAVIEAMTSRAKSKKGTIIAEKTCLHGEDRVISRYHQSSLERVIAAGANESFNFNELKITTSPTKHYNPTIGFRIDGSVSIGYTADGPYFAGQSKAFSGTDVLILNALMPAGHPWSTQARHLNTDGAAKLAKEAKPKLAVLQHFGFAALRAGLNIQRDLVEAKSGVRTIVARDGMQINLDELKPTKGLKRFF